MTADILTYVISVDFYIANQRRTRDWQTTSASKIKYLRKISMDREKLDGLTINQLRTLAAQFNIATRGSRSVILERVIEHLESEGCPKDIDMDVIVNEPRNEDEAVHVGAELSLVAMRAMPENSYMTAGQSSARQQSQNVGDVAVETMRNESNNAAINVQEIVQAVVQVMDERQRTNNHVGFSSRNYGNASPSSSDLTNSTSWHQIKFATKLIPFFSGKEEENVVKWLERVAGIARMYRLSDDIIVIAAVTQLKDRALDWYHRQTLDSLANWEEFKFQIRRHLN